MGRRRVAGLGKFGPGKAFGSSVSTREVLNAFTAVWTTREFTKESPVSRP